MADRERISCDEATLRLVGREITAVEFLDDGKSVVIRVGDTTLYADAPTAYATHVDPAAEAEDWHQYLDDSALDEL